MLFVSETFLVFFLVVYVLFWTFPIVLRIPLLLVASLVFYASWSIPFAVHFVAVIAVNYAVMEVWRHFRWKWLFFALQTANVLNIALFKYFYFFADFLGFAFGVADWRAPTLLGTHRALGQEILLPLAISFYTFQIMAYGIDIYRGTYTRRHSFLDVVLFKSFFPQLIAGPIMRSDELLPQISDYGKGGSGHADALRMKKGLWLVLIGVVKKVLVADNLMKVIAPVFSSSEAAMLAYGPLDLWLCMFCGFGFLYCDFSAYSDMARGFGLLLGFEIPINFRAPLFAHSVSEFWRRWHLTFSLWIRDYIFFPLGGSRVAEWRAHLNLLFTFFLAGLWHGASYTFVAWGVFMGLALTVEGFLERRGFLEWPKFLPSRVLRVAFSWIVILMGAAFFFAPAPGRLGPGTDAFDSLMWSLRLSGRLFDVGAYFSGPTLAHLSNQEIILPSVIGLVLFSWIEQSPGLFRPLRKFENWLLPLLGLVVVLLIVEFAGGQKDFFYFQF